MSTIDMRRALLEWVRDQQDFGELDLPAGLDRRLLQPPDLRRIKSLSQASAQTSAPPIASIRPGASPEAKTAPRASSPASARPAVTPQTAPASPAGDIVPPGSLADGPPLRELTPTHASLDELRASFADCRICGIANARQNLVFGVGNPGAELVIIGEAPGADEDRLGDPFVGAAGQLLDKILAAIGYDRTDVYICNILKCRPPNNRDPQPEEVANCSPFLLQQLALLQPKVLLAVGRIAGKTLLGVERTLGEMRKQIHQFRGVPLVVTYHPAALLRNPHWKRGCWEDVQKARELLLAAGGRPGSLTPPA